jgi:UDP-N-acetylglucosamine--N-acetylmuramyl-(pentapeptide) pyrophosphoryl-undecaprenol N-acetylglucosamine transferase
MRVLVAGGGTAGHVEPALSLASELRSRGHGVWLLGTQSGAEARLVPERGFTLLTIDKVPFPRRIDSAALTFLPRQVRVVNATRELIRTHRIDVVVGFGGYAAWPAYVAAKLLGVPSVVFSYDARPGLANRVAAAWTPWLAVGVPSRHGRFARARYTGVPLRQAIIDVNPSSDCLTAARALGLKSDRKTLVVFGGSLGAVRLNAALLACSEDIVRTGWQVLHIVGTRNQQDLQASAARETLGSWRAVGYLDDMASAYTLADLVVSRAGAVTCAELTATGVPGVLVPYAVGNGEQAENAKPLVESGGYSILADAELTGPRLWQELMPLLTGSALDQMTSAAQQWSIKRRAAGAAASLASLVEEAAGHGL